MPCEIFCGVVDPRKKGFFRILSFIFPELDMMGGLCLGALRLQRGQSFWVAEGTGDGWLAEEERRRRDL